uniref:Uncharacterized protein n=1 Tax=Gossypium raimondii TaxID=29730 RepID=A0A0D2P851_GOSRA|nr:hypothetical protein B456_004G071200 [Gossypium raimondii]
MKSGCGTNCFQRQTVINGGYVSMHSEGFCKLKECVMLWRKVFLVSCVHEGTQPNCHCFVCFPSFLL